ncbi:thiamine pyrophosphate-requiring protein [Bordetella sp. BOR01]|uniref:thiamine pyrophosphate-requiring protein n=1 Tax=Bordetella sp. BOR01 TaxID=2854779 RepID=UPI001C46392B|nr:thiamine pyrophosphate-requiring protein [Bordetella sp. BOR01]MBV7482625.1 thiamine pyrophosphate-requiring protein [Bordetella sp. BOR01]
MTQAPSVAERYLSLLKQRGIDCLYVGAGTDTAPLVEAYAGAPDAARRFPRPVVATHENLAVGMAHGYAMVTGRPQAVMLHVSVGTANAACALMNASRAQVPMLFTAGRTPLFEQGRLGARDSEIHWAQEMYDQAGMVRELVKWDYELRDGVQLDVVVGRALAIASTYPQGPVYLSLPREVLAAPAPCSAPDAIVTPAAPPAPDPAALARLADALSTARFPVVLCTASGADSSTLPLLAELADRFGIGVGEARSRHVCFPASHPLHLGHDMAAVYARADALLYLESDVPWVPSRSSPAGQAFVAQSGCDPLFQRYPIRSHRASLILTSSTRALLPALIARLAACGAERHAAERRARMAQWAGELREAVAARAARDQEQGGPISKAFLSRCVYQALPPLAIVVNEYPAVRECLPFEHAGQYYAHATSAGLGWGFPAALGAQQAAPDRTVVALMGDGAYLFANPAACHHAAAMHGLPVVAVVFDNGGWQAVRNAAVAVYPQGSAAAIGRNENGATPMATLAPMPDFRLYAQASGALGLRVDRRDELAGALAEALSAARASRPALVHVIGKD